MGGRVNPADHVRLEWKDGPRSTASCYVIYRFSNTGSLNIEDAAHIRAIIPRMAYTVQSRVDNEAGKRTSYTYIITTVDWLHNESSGSDPALLKTLGKRRAVRMSAHNNDREK